MNNNFSLNTDQQTMVITQTTNRMGGPVQTIEKDLWVTTILQIIFFLTKAKHLIFKGETSLSKMWNIIQYFSKDIDSAIDQCFWGLKGEFTKKQIKCLQKCSFLFVRYELYQSLKSAVVENGLHKWFSVEVDSDGEGSNTYSESHIIHIHYHFLFDAELPYLYSEVKLEISSRSLLEPTFKSEIKNIIEQRLPIETTIQTLAILISFAEKTSLEKAFLLHELFSLPSRSNTNKESRHLYDLSVIMKIEIALSVVSNDELWATIHHHREDFTHMDNVDYTPDIRKSICLIPPVSLMDIWKQDYNDMRSAMIYEETPTFESPLEQIKKLEGIFHSW